MQQATHYRHLHKVRPGITSWGQIKFGYAENVDQMIERQSTLGRNPDERKKALLEIQRYILDQAYLHQIHSFESPTVLQPYMRDYFPGFGGLQTEPDKWSLVWLDK